MKLWLFLSLLMVTQLGMAKESEPTLEELEIKKSILLRVENISDKLKEALTDMDKNEVSAACKKVEELGKLYEQHFTAIGTHMETKKSKWGLDGKEVLSRVGAEMLFYQLQDVTCKKGKDCNQVQPNTLKEKMEKHLASMEEQREFIEKNRTNKKNPFQYQKIIPGETQIYIPSGTTYYYEYSWH